MLERVVPHLATIGIHKNGTWAAQKIIECCQLDHERNLIIDNLRSFAPPLMCDSLGNYVCAGTLRFGPPWNEYVYDAMIDRLWDIAQNRFGARCMRTCLESPHTTLYQRVSPDHVKSSMILLIACIRNVFPPVSYSTRSPFRPTLTEPSYSLGWSINRTFQADMVCCRTDLRRTSPIYAPTSSPP